MHLIMDGRCIRKTLASKEVMESFIGRVVEILGLHLVGGPYVVELPNGDNLDSGLSAVAIIAESSITIHTYPEHNYIYIDIFSCRDFNTTKAEGVIFDSFGLGSSGRERYQILERGQEHRKPPQS